MATHSINRRYASLAVLVLFLLYSCLFFRKSLHIPSREIYASIASTPHTSNFHQYEPPFAPGAIQSVCATTQWTPGLVFTCDESGGGVGNLRNSILNCVRYAIEAGAALTIPRIVLRDAHDISKIWNAEKTDLDYIFDRQHFVTSLATACPQLRLFDTVKSVPKHDQAHEPLALLPESIVEEVPKTGLAHPEQWRDAFDNWLVQHATPSADAPMIINLARSYLQYPIYHDGASFALNFGGILSFLPPAHALAQAVLRSLSTTYALNIDFSAPVARDAFFGVHLRTEEDAVKGWPPGDWEYSRYATQSRLFLEQAPRSHTSVIYVASGDATEVAKFATDAREGHNLTVTTKFDLLHGEELEALRTLAWDQQALVDFLVLLRATDFAGVAHSSFAWNIALKRHMYSEMVSGYLDGPQMFSDELSQIYGPPMGYPEYAACMWP